MSTTQAELDFMHNFRHETDGARWAKNEIESLRQKLASSNAKIVELVAALDAMHNDSDECMDFDECTGMFVPIDEWNAVFEALAKVRKS